MAIIVVMFINHIVIVCYVLYAESNIRETALLLHQNVLIKRNELNIMQFRLLNLSKELDLSILNFYRVEVTSGSYVET